MNQIDSALKTVLGFLIDSTPAENLPSADAIFIFGHIDPRLPEHATQLYKLGKAPRIIISGKGRKKIPGFESEAKYYASILESNGIPRSAVILEEQAMNSVENVRLGIEACGKAGLHPKTLIVISVPALLRRSKNTFAKQFPSIKIYGSAFEVSFDEWRLRSKRLLGEFDRFKEYTKNGDMEEVIIPVKVAEAVEILRENLSNEERSIDSFHPIS